MRQVKGYRTIKGIRADMTQQFQLSGTDIRLSVRRSARAKRISLRVSRLDGKVTLTMPTHVAEREGLDFAQSRSGWIEKQLADFPTPIQVGIGSEVPFQGSLMTVKAGQGRTVVMENEEFHVPGGAERVPARLLGFLKEEARSRLVRSVDGYSARLGRSYSRMTIRDTRSRWGSCSSAGALMFSWRLVLAPEEVLNYVAAHEVAHLAQMNHSPAFWAVVEQLYGPHRAERNWLKAHGEKLHRYRFG